MEYRTFTGTGAKISRLCLGTMTYGSQVAEADAIPIIHRAIEGGINIIDTADAYNRGVTESIVGKALEGRRDGVVLVSKVRAQVGPHEMKDQGLARWHILKGVEASLKRLRTDCLDVLLMHQPDYSTPLEESLWACDQLVRQGKVMYYGLSNYAAWQMCQAKWIADRRQIHAPAVCQVPYNLITRGVEPELVPFLREMAVGMMVYNPLAGGLLTGKHDPARPPVEGTRFADNAMYKSRYWSDANFRALTTLSEIAERTGITLVQLALRWLAAQPAVDTMIIGASRLAQLEENLVAAEGGLDAETLAACDRVWKELRGPVFQYHR